MKKLKISAFDLAQRFIGLKEIAGKMSDPMILAMLRLDKKWPADDAVPWCSAFVNYICWLLRLPRTKDLSARSWLEIGMCVHIDYAEPGFDVVILKQKASDPGIEKLEYPGHVGFYAGHDENQIFVLSGNQKNAVNVSQYPIMNRVLGIRRLV